MTREKIVSEFVKQLKEMKTVKLGVVQRDPIIVSELPKTGFPAVYVETVEEDIIDLTTTGSNSKRTRESVMQIGCVIVVMGKERDKQRNLVVENIEKHIALDRSLNSNAKDCILSRIELVELGEEEPYASCRAIFQVKYCYEM